MARSQKDPSKLLKAVRAQGFVVIVWGASDVQALRPVWDLDKCQKALDGARSSLEDRSVERGWEVLEELISDDIQDDIQDEEN